jgi:hypothetical protein
VEKRELSSKAELLGVLRDHFELSFPADTHFGPIEARLWPAGNRA